MSGWGKAALVIWVAILVWHLVRPLIEGTA